MKVGWEGKWNVPSRSREGGGAVGVHDVQPARIESIFVVGIMGCRLFETTSHATAEVVRFPFGDLNVFVRGLGSM